MNKGVGGVLSALSLSILSIPSVFAETIVQEWGRTAAGAIAEFMGSANITPAALSTILLGILLWIVLFSVVRKIGWGEEGLWGGLGSGVVSLVIVILTFLYLPEAFLEAIVLQYGAAGAAILAFIPFAILLYFSLSVSRSLLVARIIWIFYIVYYFAIFIYKIGTTEASGAPWYEYVPYIGAMVAGVIVFFLLPKMREFAFEGKLQDKEEKAMRDINFRRLGRDIERQETTARTDFSGGSVA